MMSGILSRFLLGGPQFTGTVLDQMTEPITSFYHQSAFVAPLSDIASKKENSLLVFWMQWEAIKGYAT